MIDTSLLEEELEGIWASAVEAYLNGEPWHLSQIEEEARERLNQKFQVSDEWENPIGDYLQAKETYAIKLNIKPIVTIKELLKVIGQNPDDKKSQDRMSKILKLHRWTKEKQTTINGKRQYPWTNPSILLNPSNLKQEVKQLETIDTQGLSPATSGTPPNPKTLVEDKDNTISEEENNSNPSYEQNSLNRLSRLSTLSNPSQNKASSPTQPTTQPQQKLSTQIAIERNQIPNISSEEKEKTEICDIEGISLKLGDFYQPSESQDPETIKDWEKFNAIGYKHSEVAKNPVLELICIDKQQINRKLRFFLVGQCASGDQFFYDVTDNSEQTSSLSLREKRIRKVVKYNGQWVKAKR